MPKLSPFLYTLASIATLGIMACSSGTPRASSGPTTGPVAPAAASTIFVEDTITTTYSNQPPTYEAAILEFPASSTGTAIPAVNAPRTSSGVSGLALDASGNLYVGSFLRATTGQESVVSSSIQVYAPGFSAASAPIRTLSLPNADVPTSLCIDASGELYVLIAGTATVYVYANGASGATPPLRTISGTNTQLTAHQTFGLAVDSVGNIYVGDYQPSAVLVFSSTASGNVAPARTLSPTSGNVLGLAIDDSDNLYAGLVTSTGNVNGGPVYFSSTIAVFQSGATSASSPIRTIAGSATTLQQVNGMRVDAAGNLWAINTTGNYFEPPMSRAHRVQTGHDTDVPFATNVVEFAPSASGNVAPLTTFNSTTWGFGGSELAVE